MALAEFIWPGTFFCISTVFFYFSLRQSREYPRTILAALHLSAVISSLVGTDREVWKRLPQIAVYFAIRGYRAYNFDSPL